MIIKRLVVGTLAANCYLVWSEPGMEGIVIDPGDDGSYIAEEILREGVNLVGIVLTHGHFDHTQAVLEIRTSFEAEVMMNRKDLKLYERADKSKLHWTGQKGMPGVKIERYIKEGEVIEFGEESLLVMETPGHTPGSVCLYGKEEKVLFSGDVLFRGAVGRTDFSYSNPGAMARSLARLMKLPDETRVLPGHEEETTIEEERGSVRGR